MTSIQTANWPAGPLVRGVGTLVVALLAVPAFAASSSGCEGGGFTVLGRSGSVDVEIPGASVPATITVRGKYVRFDIDAATFGIRNYVFEATTNPLDMTNGVDTPVFASKAPNHRGLRLNGAVDLSLDEEVLEIARVGPGLSMKIQAKDCATGGVFQMEPERADGTATRIVHTLASASQGLTPFYFDNPRFRAREGDIVPFKDTTIAVPTRINIANDFSPRFVARDSAQVATRVNEPACSKTFISRVSGPQTIQHCGNRSIWDVASGGRMGFVSGEDSVEVAPSPTVCTHKCQAQNRVRGRSVVLGFPFPVPEASRLPLAPLAP
ncbi:hypothetical protein [Ramlibacter alkalitolerans]|uniref:hypothetical protein n=1 Tax=Ramlibacter alkalitolerans TaxID=2039631 RepID=UPI001F1C6825|nr:hypothetical protein [Ramlibacter alkalitolerans]